MLPPIKRVRDYHEINPHYRENWEPLKQPVGQSQVADFSFVAAIRLSYARLKERKAVGDV